MTMCAGQALRVPKFWSSRRVPTRPGRILPDGIARCWNEGRNSERHSPGCRTAESHSIRLNHQTSASHKVASIDAAERLRVQRIQVVEFANHAGTRQNLQLTIRNRKTNLGAVLIKRGRSQLSHCAIEAASRNVRVCSNLAHARTTILPKVKSSVPIVEAVEMSRVRSQTLSKVLSLSQVTAGHESELIGFAHGQGEDNRAHRE